MRYEPSIDRARFVETVREVYGLPVEGLAFVPVGYAAACYLLHGAGGARHFLKLWPDTRAVRPARDRPPADARTPRPRALPARALWTTCSGLPLAVFPFLPGRAPPPWPEWPLTLRDKLARTIAAIHRATPALADLLPPRLLSLLEEPTSAEQDAAALQGIEAWGFAQWATLDETLEGLSAVLDRRER